MSDPSLRDRYGRTLRQFVQFALVGGAGLVVNMTVAVILNKLNGGSGNAQRPLFHVWGPYYFRFTNFVWLASFAVAVVFNFVLNRYWTFRSKTRAPFFAEFWPFVAVGSVAAAVGFFIKLAFTNPVSPLYLPEPYFHENAGLSSREYWAHLLTIVITMPINFLVNKFWTFRAVRRQHHANSPASPTRTTV